MTTCPKSEKRCHKHLLKPELPEMFGKRPEQDRPSKKEKVLKKRPASTESKEQPVETGSREEDIL